RLSATIYPNGGPTITNIFDTGENLSQVAQVGGTTFYAAKGFNALRQLLGINFGNGVVTSNTYYPVSLRLQKIATSKSSSIQSLTYSYDALGNVLGVADGVYVGSASATFGDIAYDDLNRLTFATNASGSFAYGFDSIGNILTNQESGGGAYTYGSGGIRPDCVRTANGQRYTYDLDGNIVFRGLQRLDYDVNNHLYHVINTNGVITTFGYAADGSRLWELSGTNALQVWIDGNYEEKQGQILYHVSADGRQVVTFDKTGTNVFEYYHPDNLTSTSIQTDQNGNEIQNYGYSAFGQSRYTQSSTVFKVSRRYTGQVLDDATGLYYYNARYYDPVLGRFTQPDDIIPDLFNPQTYNRYAYCVNNPLRFTDPSGNAASDIADWWGGTVNTAFEYYTAGSQSTALIGTLGTVNSLVGGIAEPLRLGSSAGAVSGNPNATAGQIAIAGVQEVARAAAIIPAGAAIGKGVGTLLGAGEKEAAGEIASRVTATAKIQEITAQNGTKITGFIGHGVDRAIGNAAEKRLGVSPRGILDALKNPLKIGPVKIDNLGRPSQRFVGKTGEVVVNPAKGKIVSVNPTSSSKAAKLLGGNGSQ
ncbi:MAG: RHS repeat-associated core domain-containing protein, partial [Limisphaerales bacterium]